MSHPQTCRRGNPSLVRLGWTSSRASAAWGAAIIIATAFVVSLSSSRRTVDVSRTPGVVGPLDSAGLPSRRCQLLASLATDVVRCRWLFIVDTFSSRRRRTTSGVQERSVLVELRLKSAERNSKCLSTQAVPSWFHSCFRQLMIYEDVSPALISPSALGCRSMY